MHDLDSTRPVSSPRRRLLPRTALPLLVAVLLGAVLVRPAEAHKSFLKATVLRVDGEHEDGFVTMRPTGKGRIDLWLPGAAPGARLLIDYRLNGVPKSGVSYALQGARSAWPLGFDTKDQDKVEVANLRVVDASDQVIAVLGAGEHPRMLRILSAPLVWVVDTQSDVGFTRGGDTFLSKHGDWTVGFDALRSRATGLRLNNRGNYAQIEVSVNDGAPQVFTVTFDVQSGKSRPNGRPGRDIGTRPGDRVRIRRVEVFDAQGRVFATMGIRMGPQGHYLHELPPVPTSSPSPTPSPVPSPSPSPTPAPTPSSSPTPEPTPAATPEPTPDPTPDATPDATPDPTPDATPEDSPGGRPSFRPPAPAAGSAPT